MPSEDTVESLAARLARLVEAEARIEELRLAEQSRSNRTSSEEASLFERFIAPQWQRVLMRIEETRTIGGFDGIGIFEFSRLGLIQFRTAWLDNQVGHWMYDHYQMPLLEADETETILRATGELVTISLLNESRSLLVLLDAEPPAWLRHVPNEELNELVGRTVTMDQVERERGRRARTRATTRTETTAVSGGETEAQGLRRVLNGTFHEFTDFIRSRWRVDLDRIINQQLTSGTSQVLSSSDLDEYRTPWVLQRIQEWVIGHPEDEEHGETLFSEAEITTREIDINEYRLLGPPPQQEDYQNEVEQDDEVDSVSAWYVQPRPPGEDLHEFTCFLPLDMISTLEEQARVLSEVKGTEHTMWGLALTYIQAGLVSFNQINLSPRNEPKKSLWEHLSEDDTDAV